MAKVYVYHESLYAVALCYCAWSMASLVAAHLVAQAIPEGNTIQPPHRCPVAISGDPSLPSVSPLLSEIKWKVFVLQHVPSTCQQRSQQQLARLTVFGAAL